MSAACCAIFNAPRARPSLRSIAGVTRFWAILPPVPCLFRSLNRAWPNPSLAKAVMAVVPNVAEALAAAAAAMAVVVVVALAAGVNAKAKAKAVSVKAQSSL